MTGFSSDWLALRADADRRARNRDVAARVSRHFADRSGLDVLDIGAGTGANLRATAPLLPEGQRWRLADNDAALLARAEAPDSVGVDRCQIDLAADLAPLMLRIPDLVTASAFFDLCGAVWIERFVDRIAGAGAALYAVLNYDGREAWTPADPRDAQVLAAFHSDQHRDKGLGPALGPEAHAHLAACLRSAGYMVWDGASDWTLLAGRDRALIAALATGTAAAVAPALGADPAARWRRRRISAQQVVVGHRDLFACPARGV